MAFSRLAEAAREGAKVSRDQVDDLMRLVRKLEDSADALTTHANHICDRDVNCEVEWLETGTQLVEMVRDDAPLARSTQRIIVPSTVCP